MNEQSPAEAIFFAAQEKGTGAERIAYLDAVCAEDKNLRQRVERLLAAHPQVGSFLERPVAGTEGETAPPSGVHTGAVIAGRYKLLQPIGEGGMGSVWMAQQTSPVTRLVAMKLVKAGMDSRAILARFEAERQALAVMDHPNIAKVLDGGSTEAGRPFFVMELVKGTPITRYCDENRLPLRQRLELFVPVCQALQHAHQKGIVHRDLKPSNVLVAPYDGKPVPKVIDFGVAKATGPRLTERTLFTEFGAIIGTLQYMSPEQAELNNLDIDTRSDIYSLGVLLYELLTGTTPLDIQGLRGAAMAAVLMAIHDEEPPKPSTRLNNSGDSLPSIAAQRQTEPAKLSRLVRGELDWIAMKALEKDRNRRYETANGLARDLERYLLDEVVEAQPPSAGYRLRKFVRKHRAVLTLTVTAMLLLLIGAAVSAWQAVRAKRAQAEALAAERRADGEAVLAKAFHHFAQEQILGEHRAASEELTRIYGEMIDGPTAKSKSAEFIAGFRRCKRANDALRSLANKMAELTPVPTTPQDKAFAEAAGKAALDLLQASNRMITLAQKYPAEMSQVLGEAFRDEPKK
jgi:serine/threonine protein kinase